VGTALVCSVAVTLSVLAGAWSPILVG
jgi:hypothetical protein